MCVCVYVIPVCYFDGKSDAETPRPIEYLECLSLRDDQQLTLLLLDMN
jgi:hypothetical protein